MRIIGLLAYIEIVHTLIRLHSTPQDPMLKTSLVRALICLCANSMVLKRDDKHLRANVNHL